MLVAYGLEHSTCWRANVRDAVARLGFVDPASALRVFANDIRRGSSAVGSPAYQKLSEQISLARTSTPHPALQHVPNCVRAIYRFMNGTMRPRFSTARTPCVCCNGSLNAPVDAQFPVRYELPHITHDCLAPEVVSIMNDGARDIAPLLGRGPLTRPDFAAVLLAMSCPDDLRGPDKIEFWRLIGLTARRIHNLWRKREKDRRQSIRLRDASRAG